MSKRYAVCVFSVLVTLLACTPGTPPDESSRMTNAIPARRDGGTDERLQALKPGRNIDEESAMVAAVADAVGSYDETLRAMQAVQELIAALRRGERTDEADTTALRVIARQERAAEALLTGLRAVAVTKENYAVLTAVYAVVEQESPHRGVRCETAAQWGETAWKMYDGEMARAKLMQAIDAAHAAAEMEGGARAEQIRTWASYVAGTLAEVHAAYLDEEALMQLGQRFHESAPAEARYAWYAACWETYAQQGRLGDARRIGEEAARALPQHAGARRLNEMLAAFHNVRPATRRLARARIESLRRQKMGEETMADKLSRAAGAR